MAPTKMAEQLEQLRDAQLYERQASDMAARIAELEDEVDDLEIEASDLTVKLALLAQAVVDTPAFRCWLLAQDRSSSHERRPSIGLEPGVEIEGRDDVALALAFAGR